MTVTYAWRGEFGNAAIRALHAEGFGGHAGEDWLHVDFEDHLAGFYVQACGFTPTRAGLIALPDGP